MGEEQLYRRVMKGKRTTYELVVATDDSVEHLEDITETDINDKQALTIAGALGTTLLCLFERYIPPHRRNARKIKAVTDAIFNLYQGSGQEFDEDIATWVMKCWDETVKRASGIPV